MMIPTTAESEDIFQTLTYQTLKLLKSRFLLSIDYSKLRSCDILNMGVCSARIHNYPSLAVSPTARLEQF